MKAPHSIPVGALVWALALGIGPIEQQFPATSQPFAITVQGTLNDELGAPLRNIAAEFDLVRQPDGLTFSIPTRPSNARRARTNELGEFRLTDLTVWPGNYELRVTVDGFRPRSTSITVNDGARGALITTNVSLNRSSVATAPDPSPPTPTPPPPTPTPPAKPERRDVPDLIWNAWAERQTPEVVAPDFKPIAVVGFKETLLVTLDLAALDYAVTASAVGSKSAGPGFQRNLQRWLASTDQDTIEVKAVVFADPATFQLPVMVEKPLRISLKKLREYVSTGAPPADVFAALKNDPNREFVFGRVSFPMKVRARAGWAPLTIALWSDNRPIEEIGFAVCVSADAKLTADRACPGVRPSTSMFGGFDSLAAASGGLAAPNVALHIVALPGNSQLYGVMSLRDVPEKLSWPLYTDAADLKNLLAGAMFNAFARAQTDDHWLEKGAELRNTIFPEGLDADARAAAAQLDASLASTITMTADQNAQRPSVFIRIMGESSPFLFPIGAITSKGSHIGLLARLEVPLDNQTYAAAAPCVNRWAVLSPPLGYADDEPLRIARDAAENGLVLWQGVEWPLSRAKALGDWLSPQGPPVDTPAGLFILSHHEDNEVRFVAADNITSGAVRREFVEPSIVVFNACGTAKPLANQFLAQLNKRGFTSIVATITEVEAAMAGAFMSCWSSEMANLPPPGDRVGNIFARSIQCLHALKDANTGASRFGSKVLSYVLLGDTSTRICPAKQP